MEYKKFARKKMDKKLSDKNDPNATRTSYVRVRKHYAQQCKTQLNSLILLLPPGKDAVVAYRVKCRKKLTPLS